MRPVIFTDERVTAQPVIDELISRGLDPIVASPSRLAGDDAEISVSSERSGDRAVLTFGSTHIELDTKTRAWRWKTSFAGKRELDTDPVVSAMKFGQYQSTVRSLWETPATWMNPYTAEWRMDQNKSLGARLARQCGLSTPDTLITDSPAEFRRFVSRKKASHFALKAPASWAARLDTGEAFGAYTVRLDKEAALAVADRVRAAPVIVQPYVDKKFELRITCVGSKVFAARIESQTSEDTSVDWRRYPSEHVEHAAYTLDPQLEDCLIRFTSLCGLVYCAMDFIVTPAGETVFLEANPSGQYLWIEHLTGQPITRALADWLSGVAA